jgi:uncharacterized membrane protein
MSITNSFARCVFLLYAHSMSAGVHMHTTFVVTRYVSAAVSPVVNAQLSAKPQRASFTVSRVLRCVISVVVAVPVYVALPLDARELVEMVVNGVPWFLTLLPL